MTLATILVCDKCQAKGPIAETDGEANEAGPKAGWTIQRIEANSNLQGKTALDLCPSCGNKVDTAHPEGR